MPAPRQKVFGLGLSKTGTSSLTEALNLAGVSSIHFPHDARTLAELTEGQYRLSVLDEYQSITDLPAVAFYKQFDTAFPGSKFILTVRDLAPWLRSCEMHWQLISQWVDNFPQFKKLHEFLSHHVYGGVTFDRDRFAAVYERHLTDVRDYFDDRPDDLLVLDICAGDGWGRLCPFLGRPEPSVAFPHTNEWMHLLMAASEELQRVVPHGATVILVDEQGFGSTFAPGRRCLPFLERDGRYWGAPADDATALSEFERLVQQEAANYIVFGWPAYWWLEHYAGFNRYLRSSFRCVMENERLTVFDLDRPCA